MSIGEYESPDASLTQWHARVIFLNLLPELAPKAVNELSGTLLHSFQTTETDFLRFTNEWDYIRACAAGDARFADWYSAEQVKFYQELTAWADKYNLNARWLIEHFVQMLDWWNQFPQEAGKNMTVGLGHAEDWFGELEPFRFEHPEWNYHELKESEYRQAVEEHFRKELNIYLKRRASQAVASSEQRVKHTRTRGEINPAVRMEWFVLYQVRGLTAQQILDRYTHRLPESAKPKQVNDAVKEMSALIDLQFRPAQRGRPKK